MSSTFLLGQDKLSLYVNAGAVNFHDHQLTGVGFNIGVCSPYVWNKGKVFFQLNVGNALAEGNRNVASQDDLDAWTTSVANWTENVTHSWQTSSEFNHLPLRTSKSALFSYDLSAMKSFDIGEKHMIDVGVGLSYTSVSEWYLLDTTSVTALSNNIGVDEDTPTTILNMFYQQYRIWTPIFSLSYRYKINETLYSFAQGRYIYQSNPFSGFSSVYLGIGINI